ncbi:NAD(P)H-hydrate dehydratase [Erythrobacter sp. THAF29]|uniref:NAD(P)H-hydrate dehydratase n=1 Tax=Erythrobacter sp. THAF29 TaxID=2587851 RepID=UPI0012687D15|nr:NAD(P)H-hydrate dehydratase [Erythrobacter sp. THAF29]QFT78039.1 Bifunctional NAD(P)H-hydrate repair enzyme Nnr [Erythrobacter sp. THAF29]
MTDSQILTVSQMQAAEQAIFDKGTTVSELMEIAAGGAAEWIRRIAAGRSITVLCGPGNNGGDGYVIARRMREFGNEVSVVAPMEPATDAARQAREKWGGAVSTAGDGAHGGVFVDCLFGSGLSRPLSGEHALMVRDLAERHAMRVAIDLPSGVESDSGDLLNEKLQRYDATLALGAWKFAHWVLPARSIMGSKRLVPIGVEPTEGAAELIAKPTLAAPAAGSHKYRRGLAAIVGGEMPGAATLAAMAAQRAGAGYVKLLAEGRESLDPGLVCESGPLDDTIVDDRIRAILVGPGLGRSDLAERRLAAALKPRRPIVLDADALVLLKPGMIDTDHAILATPHDGELDMLCRNFAVIAEGRRARAAALAQASGMIVCAKGPDTVIAAPDGRLALAPPAPSWLSVAGSGDVLAGIAVSRMATGREPFEAACEAVWLHGEAARRCGAAFTASELARSVSDAYADCL